MTVALARVVRVVVPESEAISAGNMLVASHGQMAIDNAPRRSERVTQQPARLLHVVKIYGANHAPQECGVRTQGSDSRDAGHWLV